MDARHFDQIATLISAGGTRRGVLRLILSSLSLGAVLGLWLGDDVSAARRRRKDSQKRKRRKANTRGVGGENHKHKHRRRKHRNKRNHDHKPKKPCRPESLAQTCDGRCGSVQNTCRKTVDCGSCECAPACSACQTCDPASGQCQADPGQDGQSCDGCQVCDAGQCIPDASIVCAPLDQCHEAGVCDPETGACTNPVKEDGTPCGANGQCRGGVCDEEVDPRQVIGSATQAITRSDACGTETGRLCESLAGDVVTDAMRLTYGTDFALTNSGGIRADLTCPPAGSAVCPSGGAPHQITRGQVLSVLPFGNVAVTLELNGLELKAMLESAVRQMPAQSPAFPQVSGICFTYDIGAAPGNRVTGAVRQAANGSCSGEAIALSDAATYTMTTNDFTASGGDGYPNLVAKATLRDVLAEVVANFIAAESPLDPRIEGRIVCAGGGCPAPAAG